MGDQVRLLGFWASPYSRRIEVALKLKGVDYEYIEENLANKSPLLLQLNPIHKKVPVLVHNGTPIAESLVILEYIDETWKHNPILPEDPHERAMARFWAKFVYEKCVKALWKASWSKEKEREEAIQEANGHLQALEGELAKDDKRFFGGDKIGLVDIVSNFIGFWLGIVEEATGVKLMTEEKFPKLCKWSEEYVNCSVINETLPPRDKLLAFMRAQNGGSIIY